MIRLRRRAFYSGFGQAPEPEPVALAPASAGQSDAHYHMSVLTTLLSFFAVVTLATTAVMGADRWRR